MKQLILNHKMPQGLSFQASSPLLECGAQTTCHIRLSVPRSLLQGPKLLLVHQQGRVILLDNHSFYGLNRHPGQPTIRHKYPEPCLAALVSGTGPLYMGQMVLMACFFQMTEDTCQCLCPFPLLEIWLPGSQAERHPCDLGTQGSETIATAGAQPSPVPARDQSLSAWHTTASLLVAAWRSRNCRYTRESVSIMRCSAPCTCEESMRVIDTQLLVW